MEAAADTRARVREYWEAPSSISILDRNLHQLEIDTVCRHLLPSDRLADIGCGDGEATVRYATRVRECVGYERSAELRARAARAAAGIPNLTVKAGDILAQEDWQDGEHGYDVVVTQRMLINLVSWDDQRHALETIHRLLRPGGRYVMIENTTDAAAALDDLRVGVGLAAIPQHWHNRFLDHDQLMDFMGGRFQLLRTYDFGLYYLLTRVYVPMFASFRGWGAQAEKDPIFEAADAAARTLFERHHERVQIGGCRALGPIQGFVFRRDG